MTPFPFSCAQSLLTNTLEDQAEAHRRLLLSAAFMPVATALPAAQAGPSQLRRDGASPLFANQAQSSSSVSLRPDGTLESAPKLSRSKSKGKERDRGERPILAREIGSATISLRQGAVEALGESDDDDADAVQGRERADSLGAGTQLGARVGTSSSRTARSSSARPTILSTSRSSSSTSPLDAARARRDSAGSSRQTQTGSQPSAGPRDKEPGSARSMNIRSLSVQTGRPAAEAPSPSISRTRRTRAKSVHYPSRPPIGTGDSYYLSHYSMDREYSLKPGESSKRVNLELGLGGDFDASFGEALRKGTADEEISLPQEALKVLTEAKENLGERISKKQGRKGSIGLGLFKESRESAAAAAAVAAAERRKALGRLDEQAVDLPSGSFDDDATKDARDPPDETRVKQKDRAIDKEGRSRSSTSAVRSGPETPVKTRSATPPRTPSSATRPAAIPIPSSRPPRAADHALRDEALEGTSAGIRIVSSPLLRHMQSIKSGTEGEAGSSIGDDSGWTTESTSSLSEEEEDDEDEEADGMKAGAGASDPRTGESGPLSDTDEEDEDEDRMTVPLMPFNHAVGGHSSIYKFTRRAVCKVGPSIEGSACQLTFVATRQPREPVLRRGGETCSSVVGVYPSIPRRHDGQLPPPTPVPPGRRFDTCGRSVNPRLIAGRFPPIHARRRTDLGSASFAAEDLEYGLEPDYHGGHGDSRSGARLQPARGPRLAVPVKRVRPRQGPIRSIRHIRRRFKGTKRSPTFVCEVTGVHSARVRVARQLLRSDTVPGDLTRPETPRSDLELARTIYTSPDQRGRSVHARLIPS